MSTQSDISIIIPMYNSEKYIKEAIESILNQSFQNFEIIILDDFSSDNSREVLRLFKDPRISLYCSNRKRNVAILRNIGNELAIGKYIAVMDSDDIMPPYRLMEQFNFLEKNSEIGVVGGHCQMFGDKEGLLKNCLNSETINCGLLYRTTLFHGTAMIRKSVFKKFDLKYRENYFVGEDWALWVDMINKVKMCNLDRCFLYYRIHDQSISSLSKSDEEMKRRRKATLNKIRITAINNFGFKLEEEEITLFNDFFGEVEPDKEKFTKADILKINSIIIKMKAQAKMLALDDIEFANYTDMWSNKMAQRHGINYEE